MSDEGVTGILVVDKAPLDECYPAAPADFVRALTEYLSVQITGAAGDIIVGPNTPSTDEANKFWMKIDNNRNYLGLFFLQNGSWTQVTDAYPGEVRWFSGTTTLPTGWTALATIKGEDLKQEAIAGAVAVPATYIVARYDRS